jgi:hypothetical protein
VKPERINVRRGYRLQVAGHRADYRVCRKATLRPVTCDLIALIYMIPIIK